MTNTELEISSTRTFIRNKKVWVDARTNVGRLRFSSGENKERENEIKKDIENLIFKYLYGEQKDSKKLTIKRLHNEMIELLNIKPQSKRTYSSIMNVLIKAFGNKDIRSIPRDSLRDFLQNLSSPKRYANYLNRLITYANEQYNTGLRKINALNNPLKVLSREILPFSLSEIKAILDEAKGEVKTYLAIAFFTGLRQGEILALTYGDIDIKNKRITINKSLQQDGELTSPKTKNSLRDVDIIEPLLAFLPSEEKLKDEAKNDRIFTLKRVQIVRIYKAILQKLHIPYRVIYQTRHTFATLMLSNNEDPFWVCAMMGHSSLSVTYDNYAKYIPKTIKRASFLDEVFTIKGE